MRFSVGTKSARGIYHRCTSVVLFCMLVLAAFSLSAEPKAGSENTVKAVLLYKLTKFVTWPAPDGSADGAAPEFNLCVLGRDPFGQALEPLEARAVGDQSIMLHRLRSGDPLGACHMIFIAQPVADNPAALFDEIGDQPILTVSDSVGFALAGGMIEITRERKRLGFNINVARVRNSRLSVAAPLLDLANVVGL